MQTPSLPKHKRNQNSFLRSIVQLEPGKPAIAQGLRAAIAVGVPLLVGQFVGQIGAATMIALGALLVFLTDTGGIYRTKVAVMGTATLGVGLAALIGTVVGASSWLSIGLMFIVGTGAGFAAIYGNEAAIVGLQVAIAYLTAIIVPGSVGVALERCGQLMLGGTWAMFLVLWLWLLHPYQVLQQAIANCYQLIAAAMIALATANHSESEANRPNEEQWNIQHDWEQKIQNALEIARNRLVATRITQQGSSQIGDQLLMLFQIAEHLFADTIALADVLAAQQHQSIPVALQELTQAVLEQIAGTTQNLSSAIAHHSTPIRSSRLDRTLASFESERQRWRQALRDRLVEFSSLRQIGDRIQRLETLAQHVSTAAEVIQPQLGKRQQADFSLESQVKPNSIWMTLRSNLTLQSVGFRYALRLGLTAATSVWLFTAFHLHQGFWITLTIFIILKPDFGGTLKRAYQRVGGTLIGGIVAAILLTIIKPPLILTLIAILLFFMIVAFLPLSYTIAVVFITPFALILSHLVQPGDWQLAGIRVIHTALGGILALLGGYLILPTWEQARFSKQLAQALRASAIYTRCVLISYVQPRHRAAIWEARRQAELENTNVSTAFQRVISEPQHHPISVESTIRVLSNLRQLSNSLTTLTVHLDNVHRPFDLPELTNLAQQIESVLLDLADAVEQQRLPRSLPKLDDSVEQVHACLETVFAQRESELRLNRNNTPIHHAALAYSPLDAVLGQMLNQLKFTHNAILESFS